MERQEIIQIFDGIFSALLMVSYWVASKRNEGMRDSLQFNIVNIIASSVFIVIGICLGTYGYALRQSFFALVSIRNLYIRYKKKGNGRA